MKSEWTGIVLCPDFSLQRNVETPPTDRYDLSAVVLDVGLQRARRGLSAPFEAAGERDMRVSHLVGVTFLNGSNNSRLFVGGHGITSSGESIGRMVELVDEAPPA